MKNILEVLSINNTLKKQFDKDLRLERYDVLIDGEWTGWSEWENSTASFTVDEYIEAMNIPESLKVFADKVIIRERLEVNLKSSPLPGGPDAKMNWITLYLSPTINLFIESIVERVNKSIKQ